MQDFKSHVLAGAALLAMGIAPAYAADLPGKFEGVTVNAKLIGGQQYETLYARIADWEKATGAKVNILSKKNHFELDKEIKSDMASGSINWCVGSNHSSFAPQYGDLYTDLKPLLPKEEIDAFVPSVIKASMLNGKLVMLPRAQFDVSALYYQKSLYQDEARKKAFKENTATIWHRQRPGRKFPIRRSSSPIRRISTAPSSQARKRRSMAASMKCWLPRVVNISTRTASLPSIPMQACARSTGS